LHGTAATPRPLVETLCRRKGLERITLYHLHTAGPCPFADPEQAGRILSVSLFTGPALRQPVAEGRADFMPVFLSDIPKLFATRQIPLDVALVQVSPPDRHGLCTLGTSVDGAKAAADSARLVIAEFNERMPATHGNTMVRFDRFAAFIHTDRPLPEAPPPPEDDTAARRRHRRPKTTPTPASANRSRRWSKTARRCKWASAPFPTRCSRG
jgi:acyl-CoA hydrolase